MDEDGFTCLHYAVLGGSIAVLDTLWISVGLTSNYELK